MAFFGSGCGNPWGSRSALRHELSLSTAVAVGKAAVTEPSESVMDRTSWDGGPSRRVYFRQWPSGERKRIPPAVPAHTEPSGAAARAVIRRVEVKTESARGTTGIRSLARASRAGQAGRRKQ